MKYFLFITIFFVSLSSCTNQGIYPQIIQELKLEKKYDKAKWELYRLYYECEKGEMESLKKELEFQYIEEKDNNIILAFHFKDDYLPKSVENGNCRFYCKVGFEKNTDKITLLGFGENVIIKYQPTIQETNNKDFIKAVSTNAKNINEWLVDYAQKQKLL